MNIIATLCFTWSTEFTTSLSNEFHQNFRMSETEQAIAEMKRKARSSSHETIAPSWNKLVAELLLKILSYLGPNDLLHCSEVNSHWNSLASTGWYYEYICILNFFSKMTYGDRFVHESGLWERVLSNHIRTLMHSYSVRIYNVKDDFLTSLCWNLTNIRGMGSLQGLLRTCEGSLGSNREVVVRKCTSNIKHIETWSIGGNAWSIWTKEWT